MDSKSSEKSVEKKSTYERVKGLVELIPIIGPFLKYLIEHWGIKETIFAVAGFIIGWGIVYFGYAPGFLISEYKEKSLLTREDSKPNEENKRVSITVYVTDEKGAVSNAQVTLKAYLHDDLKVRQNLPTDDRGIVNFELADSLEASSVNVEVDAPGYRKKNITQKFTPVLQVCMERLK